MDSFSWFLRHAVNIDDTINMFSDTLSAQEAAAKLGVSVATIYAYVSRGLIRSIGGDVSKRTRRYSADDVERMLLKREHRRDPARVAQDALHFGSPVLDSAITRIEDHVLYYRDENVRDLAGSCHVEEVGQLIWGGEPGSWSSAALPAFPAAYARLPVIERFAITLAREGANDELAFDLRTPAVRRTGARILSMLVETACGKRIDGGIAKTLARAWAPKIEGAQKVLDAALILCADHELNISAFTARCVASAGATPYAAVAAGLHALTGFRHGGEALRTEALLKAIESPRAARAHASAMLRRGEHLPGFGHRLYPKGDPRARHILDQLRSLRFRDETAFALEKAMLELKDERPTIDFALAVICRALALPEGSPLVLFALGRTIGFIGHAIEQYETGALIRPRARYVGPRTVTG
jgi:citrate synthase